jgi:hypothetical protein
MKASDSCKIQEINLTLNLIEGFETTSDVIYPI